MLREVPPFLRFASVIHPAHAAGSKSAVADFDDFEGAAAGRTQQKNPGLSTGVFLFVEGRSRIAALRRPG